MENKVFGNLDYDFGFEKDIKITLFGKESYIKLFLIAYSEDEEITSTQEKSYILFQENEKKYIELVENSLEKNYGSLPQNRFTIKTMMIDKDGELALLFDDKEDPDEGIAVQIIPELLISDQSNYL